MDKITYQEYRRFPAEKLGLLVSRYVSENVGERHDALHASIHRRQDGQCPFFGPDQLCGIQKEYGAKLLSSTCSIYPRSLMVVDGVLEGALSLSCPEAARAVLLHEGSTGRSADLFSGDFRTDNVFGLQQRPNLGASFLPIRALITGLILDRSRPLWQRLLYIASLCSRLDDASEGELRNTSRLLRRYRNALGQGPSSELEKLQPDIAIRLQLAVTLSNQRCQDPDCGKRFKGVFWDFIEGIGSLGGGLPEQDLHRFSDASQNHLNPFLDHSPHILENYLLNYVYQRAFPFGRTGSDRFIEHSMFDEAVLLLTQFSWWTTLLIGVAGRYGNAFSQAEVITTIQSFTRAVEHAPTILEDALAFVKSRSLDDLPGLAKLLRT